MLYSVNSRILFKYKIGSFLLGLKAILTLPPDRFCRTLMLIFSPETQVYCMIGKSNYQAKTVL